MKKAAILCGIAQGMTAFFISQQRSPLSHSKQSNGALLRQSARRRRRWARRGDSPHWRRPAHARRTLKRGRSHWGTGKPPGWTSPAPPGKSPGPFPKERDDGGGTAGPFPTLQGLRYRSPGSASAPENPGRQTHRRCPFPAAAPQALYRCSRNPSRPG